MHARSAIVAVILALPACSSGVRAKAPSRTAPRTAAAPASASATVSLDSGSADLEDEIVRRFANDRPAPSGNAARVEVTPIPFDIETLPIAHGALPLTDPQSASFAAIAGSSPVTDIVTTHDSTGPRELVSVKDATFATIRVGASMGWSGTDGTTGTPVDCNATGRAAFASTGGKAQLAWEAVRSKDGGSAVEYTFGGGWLDLDRCKPAITSRGAAIARPIVRHFVYGFRDCATTCAERQTLVLLLPRAQAIAADGVGGDTKTERGAFTRVAIPIRPGGGGSVLARIRTDDLAAWRKAVGAPAAPKEAVDADAAMGDAFVSIEVVQAVADRVPIAVAYVDALHDETVAK